MVNPKPNGPLHEKSIYLDLFGHKHGAEFEKSLKLLGAVVEKCFSKEVTHVITDRVTRVNFHTSSASKTPASAVAIANPLNLTPLGDTGGSLSPFAISPGMTETVSRPMTRGQAIVQKAVLSRKHGSTNVIECAQRWNIKVIHIDAAVKWVKKELEVLEAKKQEKKSKVMQLKRQYIKVEDSRGCFYPEFKVLPEFPSLKFNSPHGSCPFGQLAQPHSVHIAGHQTESSPKQKPSDKLASVIDHREIKANSKLSAKLKRKKPDKERRKPADAPDINILTFNFEQLMTAGDLQRLKALKVEAARQKGFCEMCDIKYDNLLRHLNTKKHKSYIEDDGNYQGLDHLISRIRDRAIFQIDPMNSSLKVTALSSSVSSEGDEYDYNLLSMPSSLSSCLKMKVPFEGSNAVQQNTISLPPKLQVIADEAESKEPEIDHCMVQNTFTQNGLPENRLVCSGQKPANNATNFTSLNTMNNVGTTSDNLEVLNDCRCENLTKSKQNINLQCDNIPERLESEASCKMNTETMSSQILSMQQSDNCVLGSEGVSSEIPVIQSICRQKDPCNMDSKVMSSKVPVAELINSEEVSHEVPVLQLPSDTDQFKIQSQLSCHTNVTGSKVKCQKRRYSEMTDSPLKCHKHHYSDVTGSPFSCPKCPPPEVTRLQKESLGPLDECFAFGCMSQKRKRIKFSQAVSVLTNRSVVQLFGSDTSSNFEGFSEVNEHFATDLSYSEVSEAVFSVNSEFYWTSSTSSDSSLDFHSADAESGTPIFPANPVGSIAPLGTSVPEDCTPSEAYWERICPSETPVTDSTNNQKIMTILNLLNLESDNNVDSSDNASLNHTRLLNHIPRDTPPFSLSDCNLCTSQREDFVTYLDNDESDLSEMPVTLNKTCSSLCLVKRKTGMYQFSADDQNGSVRAVDIKLNQCPAEVKLPLKLTDAKSIRSRSLQPVVCLRKCDDWERERAGDREEREAVSGLQSTDTDCSHSAVQDEMLESRSSEVYLKVQESNRFCELRRKLNFSCGNDENLSSGLEERKSFRKKEIGSSGKMNSLPSENTCKAWVSNADVLLCRDEMPAAKNVLGLVVLEGSKKLNVQEAVLTTGRASGEQEICSQSSSVVQLDGSTASHFSDDTRTRRNHSVVNKDGLVLKNSVKCKIASSSTAEKNNAADKNLGRNTFDVGVIPVRTDKLAKITGKTEDAIVLCNPDTQELSRTDQDLVEMGANCNPMGKIHFGFTTENIQNNKLWQPVVMLDRSSLKPNVFCLYKHNISVLSESDARQFDKMSSAEKPLSCSQSVVMSADTFGFKSPCARAKEISTDEQKVNRSVGFMSRCDSQPTDSCADVSKQKILHSKAGLSENKNFFGINNHGGSLVQMIPVISYRTDMNVAVDFNRNNNTFELREHEAEMVDSVSCGLVTSEKLTARSCSNSSFRNSNLLNCRVRLSDKKKWTDADVNLQNTNGTVLVSGHDEVPKKAARRISLRNSGHCGQSSSDSLESSEISFSADDQKVKHRLFSQLNRSFSRNSLDPSKPETYSVSSDSELRCIGENYPKDSHELFTKNVSSFDNSCQGQRPTGQRRRQLKEGKTRKIKIRWQKRSITTCRKVTTSSTYE